MESVDPKYYRLVDVATMTHSEDAHAIAKLRGFSDVLLNRLPRLTALVRTAMQQDDQSIHAWSAAITLSHRLLPLRDDKAEDAILHRCINITRSQSIEDVAIVLWSLQFFTRSDFFTAVHYWLAQTALIRLYLCGRRGMAECGVLTSQPMPSFQDQLDRYRKNLLMACSYGCKIQSSASRRLYPHMLITIWGILLETAPTKGNPGRGNDELLKTWLLNKTNSLRTQADLDLFTARDMDQAAELFTGGPLEGAYLDVHDIQPSKAP
jgi:hypothetical protein